MGRHMLMGGHEPRRADFIVKGDVFGALEHIALDARRLRWAHERAKVST